MDAIRWLKTLSVVVLWCRARGYGFSNSRQCNFSRHNPICVFLPLVGVLQIPRHDGGLARNHYEPAGISQRISLERLQTAVVSTLILAD
jgi:hypothetical protein